MVLLHYFLKHKYQPNSFKGHDATLMHQSRVFWNIKTGLKFVRQVPFRTELTT